MEIKINKHVTISIDDKELVNILLKKPADEVVALCFSLLDRKEEAFLEFIKQWKEHMEYNSKLFKEWSQEKDSPINEQSLKSYGIVSDNYSKESKIWEELYNHKKTDFHRLHTSE